MEGSELKARSIHCQRRGKNSSQVPKTPWAPHSLRTVVLMDGEWKEVARLSHPPPSLRAIPTCPNAVAFDSSQELLWTGNEYGRVTSFYGTELRRYSSFMAHPAGGGAVHQILFHEKGVIALGSRSVHMALRRGPPVWHITHEGFKDLRCMTFISKSEILVAGYQDQMFLIDVVKGEVTQQVQTNKEYTMIKRCRHTSICAATKTGSIDIMDPKTFEVTKTWEAHSAGVNDMDAQHDFIVTCGFSIRQGRNMLDPLVNVFDLKLGRPLGPVPFPAGAAYVRIHPKMSTTCLVASQSGQIHVVDLVNPNTSNVKQANVLSHISKIAIAPSGEALAIVADQCDIHLWGSPARITFAEISNPVEFASIEEFPTLNDWEAPLNSIGMPHYREPLLSAWPSHLISELGAPPVKIDPQWLASLRPHEVGVYGPAKPGRRNQVQNTRMSERGSGSLQTPKFLSERARDSAKQSLNERRMSEGDTLGLAGLPSRQAEVPAIYQRIDIKYSKFGVEDFDFGYYNKTQYSGLETHIPNCYANSLLQILHSTPLIRNFALHHAATNCINDTCLLCELGFLFDMLEKAEGSICQATNMLKTLNCHSQAVTQKLLEEESHDIPSTNMLQSLARFLLERVVQDYRNIPPYSSALDQALAMNTTESFRCLTCRSEHSKPMPIAISNLIYPTMLSPRSPRAPPVSFSQVLKASIERDSPDTATRYCTRCRAYRPLHIRRQIHGVPPVLMLNAAVVSHEAKQLWATPGWLPEEIGIIIDQSGQFFCYEGKDLETHLQRGMHNITVYSLIGFAADIEGGPHQKSHLVSLINVAHSMRSPPSESKWHLFNDFLVRPVLQEEALTFNSAWKLPSVIAYQLKAANNRIDDSWKQNLDTTLLYQSQNRNNVIKTYRSLEPTEAPGPGTIVAIDTEFVSVKQSEIEMNADGEQQTIRPMVYALARVSVVRGTGHNEGLPLIDDYIASKEKIYDYLTSFSGIREGDLDPLRSRHNIVPLKLAYKKLWILLNLGCTFLGHSLKMDFRVTNIQIPKSQIIDTSDFFFIEKQKRKLGLAFLAWYLLKEDIQVETHDSIEDARTALKLYRKYQEFTDAGILEQMVEDIYAKGREVGWRPPTAIKSDGELVERMETPPIPPQVQGANVANFSAPSTPVKRIGLHKYHGYGWSPSPLR